MSSKSDSQTRFVAKLRQQAGKAWGMALKLIQTTFKKSPTGRCVSNVVSLRSARTSLPRSFSSSVSYRCKKANPKVGFF